MQIWKYVEDAGRNTPEPAGECERIMRSLVLGLVQLPSEPIWHSCISLLCYLTVTGHVILSVDGKCATQYTEYNFSSIFYIIDFTIAGDTIVTAFSMYYLYKHPEITSTGRPIILLVVELLSVVPLESISDDDNIRCTLALNRSLRIALIIYFNSKRSQQITCNIIFNRLVETCSYFLFLTLMSFAVYCNVQHHAFNTTEYVCHDHYLGRLSSMVTSMGYPDAPTDITYNIISIAIQMSVFYYVATAATAYFSVAYVSHFYNQVSYSSCTLGMMLFLKRLHAPKYLKARVNEEFHLVWSMKRTKCYDLSLDGCSTGISFLHPSMYNELNIDIAWASFKHSHLFRNMDFYYLRYLADYVALEYKLPGEYVYMKGEWKNKMIYISTGTIEILSNENQQSSILSLCEGTLIGACTLLLSYKSSHYIRCKTFCEFHILNKTDFIKSSILFPEEFKKAKEIVFERYRDTVDIHEIGARIKRSVIRKRENVDPYTLLWVKNTLHRLMAVDVDSTYRHEFQNIYLITEVQVEQFNKLLFHATYLDMLVVKERLQVDTDSVFVRSQFPFIFQPGSILGIAWEGLIIIITIVMAFAVPYIAFAMDQTPDWYSWYIIVVTYMYVMDVLIQLSTATKSRHAVTATFKETAKARIQTLTFWMDVGALIPMGTFNCLISTVVDNRIKAQLQLNRLLKIYRIQILFDRWDQQFNGNKLMIRYIKFFIFTFYVIFLLYCLLGYWLRGQVTDNLWHLSTFIVTETYIYGDFVPPDLFYPLLNLFCKIFRIALFSNIMTGFVMQNLSKFQVHDIYTCMMKVLDTNSLAQKYGTRILQIMQVEWDKNRCVRLRPQGKVVCSMSGASYSEFVSYKIADALKKIECFKGFSDDLIHDICEILHIVNIPPNEPISYGGDINNSIIFVHKGTYNIFDEYGTYIRTQSTASMINLLEGMMKIAAVNTFITVTHCRLFVMEASQFRSVLTKHYQCSKVFLRVLKRSSDIRGKLIKRAKKNIFSIKFGKRTKGNEHFNFYHFKGLIKNSHAEYDYFVPFDRLYPFSFIRYFFMRKTIYPHGTFIMVWEIGRCACAILTGIFTFFIPLTESIGEVLLVLDFTALLDMYVRLHVAYYNKDGVLIYHPLATAKHYLKGAFAVDFIGMCPTTIVTTPYQGMANILLKLNKLLQMYRYLGFISMYTQHKISSISRVFGLTFIPVLLVCGVFSSAIITVLQCDLDVIGTLSVHLNCIKGNAFEFANISTPIDAIPAQLFAIFMTSSILTTAGIEGFAVPAEIKAFMSVLSVIGLFGTVTFAGRFIALYSFTHGALLKYQTNIKSLLVHLNCLNVSANFQKEMVTHYEIKWKALRTREVHDFLGRVSFALKMDVLYDLYGEQLYFTSVFVKRDISFYRNLLVHLKYDIIAKGGFLGRTNDIASNIYIVFNGEVEVLSPNGELEATLQPGSIFGNMNNKEYVRYYTSYKAVTHVEFLHMPAKTFFRILEIYPIIAKEYVLLRSIHIRYITAKRIPSIIKRRGHSSSSVKTAKVMVFKGNTKRMEFWQMFALVIVCYVGNILNLYQIGVQEYSYTMLSILYVLDVAFVIQYFIRSRTAYTDSRGAYITDLKAIRKHWKENKLLYLTRIFSLIPFELPIFLLFNVEESTKYLLLGLMRSNRYCRLIYIFVYFTQKTHKLNVNVYLMRIGYILLWTNLALIAITTCIILPGSLMPDVPNIYPRIPSYEDIYYMSSQEKFQLYIRYVMLAASFINFTPQESFFPVSPKYTVFFILILMVSMHLMYFCYSQMYSLIDQCSFYQIKYRDILNQLDNFMRREDVSIALYDRIVNYVQMRWRSRGTDVYPTLMEEAPTFLQEEIYMSVFGHIINKHYLFQSCHPDLLRQIAGKIRTRTFYNGNYLQFEGVNDDCMYFILNGEVNAMTDTGKIVKTLRSDEVFGVMQGLDPKRKHEYTYVATKNSMVGILNRTSWMFLLEFFPLDKVRLVSAANEHDNK